MPQKFALQPKPSMMKDDATSYLLEYWQFLSALFPCLKNSNSNQALSEESALIDSKISNFDVVLVGKGGCGYCKRAKETLAGEAQSIFTVASLTYPFAYF